MKAACLLACSLFVLPASQAPQEREGAETSFSFGSAPVWLYGEKEVAIEALGAATLAGPVSTAMLPARSEEARETYFAIPTNESSPASAKKVLRKPWRVLVFPPAIGDLAARSLQVQGRDLAIRQEAFQVETSCGTCGHQGPAIWVNTEWGKLQLPVKLDTPTEKTPPPSKVRFR